MRNKYFVVASFETSDENCAREIENEVTKLLQKQVTDQRVSDDHVSLRAVLGGTDRTTEASDRSSMPLMALSCDDIFDIEPDAL